MTDEILIHKATEEVGRIVAYCGSRGYQLAEQWGNVTCPQCLQFSVKEGEVSSHEMANAWDECASEAHSLGWMHDAAVRDMVERNPYRKKAPTEPGWYCYSGGAQSMIFSLYEGQWYAHIENGSTNPCEWGYIEQALGVWDLIRVDLPKETEDV